MGEVINFRPMSPTDQLIADLNYWLAYHEQRIREACKVLESELRPRHRLYAHAEIEAASTDIRRTNKRIASLMAQNTIAGLFDEINKIR